ncbi:hypothetical protein SAMN05192575_10378 [Nocardioides alpinus]|uniref:Uncharacterized protein n=1 Tax=Nocardioides alpinus TaxID=748909 RepID=A0A1I0XWB2_9ACTN|nr:hypothetical protein [Nocardioides alpinus]PKH42799.1 hypothetical protein CXG46_05960 [Nocardioides alpinus]SFB05292.1 hypothetical protein SAMN05192575_10378 [Nocardioides alpinus]
MPKRSRPTQHSTIARSFGGRSGFVSQELDHRDRPEAPMSRWERASARLTWDEVANHYEEYEDENHFRIGRLVPSTELLISIGIVLFFFGSFAAFIAVLALTR